MPLHTDCDTNLHEDDIPIVTCRYMPLHTLCDTNQQARGPYE